MGAGASMLPGGTDALPLGSLPTMTLIGTCGYLSVLIGFEIAHRLLRFVCRPSAVACLSSGCLE